jgi:hypothetical protein
VTIPNAKARIASLPATRQSRSKPDMNWNRFRGAGATPGFPADGSRRAKRPHQPRPSTGLPIGILRPIRHPPSTFWDCTISKVVSPTNSVSFHGKPGPSRAGEVRLA